MLEFFRRYQRSFFITITAVIIASFLFFGASPSWFQEDSEDEKAGSTVIARTVNGLPITLAETQRLARFIAIEAEETLPHRQLPNLCNDGVIRNDFLKTGIDALLRTAYPEACQQNFPFIAAQFILNVAAVAEQKGHHVSFEEAKGDLLWFFQKSLQKLQKKEGSPLFLSMSQHLKSLGFQEKAAAAAWRKVLLFRRYFQGISSASFIDRLPFKDFFSYARESIAAQMYQWPSEMRFHTFEDLIAFETYLSAIAPPRDNPLDFPSTYYSLAQIEAEYPELIQASYTAQVKEVSLVTASLRIPLKKLWDWQGDEAHWELLRKNFSFLPLGDLQDKKLQAIHRLKPEERFAVDFFSRMQILSDHPEYIEASLNEAFSETKTLEISPQSTSLKFIQKPWKLSKYLRQGAEGEKQAQQALQNYSDDGKTLYRIEKVSLLESPRILSFAEAKAKKILDPIVERRLWSSYRKTIPGKQKKPFAEMKIELAKAMFSGVLRAIEEIPCSICNNDSYAHYRLLRASQIALKHLQASKTLSNEEGVQAQFKLINKEMTIQRTTQEEWMKNQAFAMMPNEWSPIHVPNNGDIAFFYVENKKARTAPILDPISFSKQIIAADAQMYLAEKLLKTIIQNNSIVILKEPNL